jgi:hypothetical protein
MLIPVLICLTYLNHLAKFFFKEVTGSTDSLRGSGIDIIEQVERIALDRSKETLGSSGAIWPHEITTWDSPKTNLSSEMTSLYSEMITLVRELTIWGRVMTI